MFSLIITLAVVCILLWLAYWLITTLLPLPDPMGRVVQVVFVVLAVLVVIWFLMALPGVMPHMMLR